VGLPYFDRFLRFGKEYRSSLFPLSNNPSAFSLEIPPPSIQARFLLVDDFRFLENAFLETPRTKSRVFQSRLSPTLALLKRASTSFFAWIKILGRAFVKRISNVPPFLFVSLRCSLFGTINIIPLSITDNPAIPFGGSGCPFFVT